MALSRRGFLFTVAAGCFADEPFKGRIVPPAATRYADPATEFPIIRLTDPQFSSLLPFSGNRVLSKSSMLYASDQTGQWEAFRMELKKGESRQLTESTTLDTSSIAYLPNDKGFWHFDAGRLIETDFSKLKPRELYRVPEGFEKTPGVSYSDDGQHAAFVEKSAASDGAPVYRLRVLSLQKETAATLLESHEEIRDPLLQPKHSSLVYRIGDEIRIVNIDVQQHQRLQLAEGEIGQFRWSADGHSLLYLNRPKDPHRLTSLREWAADPPPATSGKAAGTSPGGPRDTLIAQTSQFVHFSPNADASVFVGSSGSKASPYILLLARAVKREFTLAEHRASDAAMVTPLFAPNSQFVAFVSDRHGKPAIYYISVEKFVSETEGS